jgi:hypothetical protein
MRLVNKVIEHALGYFKIGDHAVFHRTDSDDISRCAPHHVFGFFADRFNLSVILVNGDNGRFVDDNALPLGKNQGIGRSEIDGQIGRNEAK